MKLFMAIFALLFISSISCSTDFDVQPDSTDFITYGLGGGELGAEWTEITIKGNGEVQYHYRFPLGTEKQQRETSKQILLSSKEMKNLLQSLVSAGLFDLSSEPTRGADIPASTIKAEIDGHTIQARIDNLFTAGQEKNSQWKQVHDLLWPLIKRAHPERRAN
jgi:hypothetical protein